MLSAITAYFNPAGYRRRLLNYHTFRERLNLPLIAVECAFGGEFELKPGDADVLIQLPGGDIMWQKERLLNIALQSLPPECTAVAWLDCDIVFAEKDWPERALAALEDAAIVHLFRERYHPPPGARPEEFGVAALSPVAESSAHLINSGRRSIEIIGQSGLTKGWTNGLAWAARRDILATHGLYDACIVGSGDRAILAASYGRFDIIQRGLQMGEPRSEHYLSWARPFHADVSGRVAAVDGAIYHLWHGDIADRLYATRHSGLSGLDFNPSTDITHNGRGAWRWSSDKPALHAYVRDFFWLRNEDGRQAVERETVQ